MPYIVKSTEKTRKSGAETETKPLLYLMNFRNDSEEIYYFIVDFFNDLTGMDTYSDKLWDLQSKGVKGNSPKAIGKELVTLFKNFLSDFDFVDYILFVGGVSNTLRLDSDINSFGIENVRTDARKKMIEGLKEEATDKEYIENSDITDDNIVSFLKKVTFVVDNKSKRFIEDREPELLPNITAHILRHTACTRMAEAGMDQRTLQEIMGHSNLAITMKVYNHVDDKRMRDEIEKFDEKRNRDSRAS